MIWIKQSIVKFIGQLNEYAVLKDQARKKIEGGAGLDGKADFDEYTIYDQGSCLKIIKSPLRTVQQSPSAWLVQQRVLKFGQKLFRC